MTPVTKYVLKFVSVVAGLSILVAPSESQSVCVDPKKPFDTETTVFIESFSANKCMRVEGLGIKPDSNVVLDECSYQNKMSQDQQFHLVRSTIDKTMIKTDAGRGDTYCLVLGNDHLRSTLCNAINMDQNWTLKPVRNQPNQFLIEQFSSKKCLKPNARISGSRIQLVSCNSLQTEQIWKVYMKLKGNQSKPLPLISC